MELVEQLESSRDEVLKQAAESLRRAHLKHYEASGPEQSEGYLDRLYGLVVDCLSGRTLEPLSSYAESVANDRFNAGFEIAEVQTAFNVLEEAVWHIVLARMPPESLAEAAGLIGTVLGAGKDTLARTWVSLATSTRVPSLDLAALFQGAAN